jgi:hypothetical protein
MRRFVRFMLVALSAAFLAILSNAQQSAPASAPTSAAITNADVIALVSAGLSDDLVIAKIHAANATNFDTSVDGLKSLKAASVSNAVIHLMIDPSAVPPAPGGVAATGDPDDPNSPHPLGIYIRAKGPDGAVHLTRLEGVTSKGMKTSGILAHEFSYGIAKAHTQAVIDGSKAPVEVTDTNPVFYAYIPENDSSFRGGTISVRDFLLVKLDVKGNTRVINTTSIGFASVSTGSDDKARQGFSSEPVKPGIYKLTLANPLPAGEYAFQQSGRMFYDFGIQPAQ